MHACGFQGFRFLVSGFPLVRVQGFGVRMDCRVETRVWVYGAWFRVSGSGFRVQGFGFRGVGLRFRGGLVFKAHRRLYHSTLGSRVIKKRETPATARQRVSV